MTILFRYIFFWSCYMWLFCFRSDNNLQWMTLCISWVAVPLVNFYMNPNLNIYLKLMYCIQKLEFSSYPHDDCLNQMCQTYSPKKGRLPLLIMPHGPWYHAITDKLFLISVKEGSSFSPVTKCRKQQTYKKSKYFSLGL